MNRPRRTHILIVAVLVCCSSLSWAQRTRYVNSRMAAQVGLDPVWSTAVATGVGGKITSTTIYVSDAEAYQTTVITDRFGKQNYFSERDVRRGGSMIGRDQALRLAELREAELKARGLEPVVETQSVAQVTVYLRTSLGTIVALDGETGHHKWTTRAGHEGYPNYAVAASEEHVVTISGSTLYLLRADNGEILQTKRLMWAPGAGPSLYENLIYAPGSKGLVEVYSTENLDNVAYTLGSAGRIRNPVNIAPKSVSWTSDLGYVHVAVPGERGSAFQFQALDAISSSPAHLGDKLYATSADGFVYAINEKNGEVVWRHSTGEAIDRSPLTIDDTVFVITNQGSLACMDAATGDVRGLASGVKGFVSASDTRLYCTTGTQTLVAFDRSTGGVIGETALASTELPIVNTKTDRIYLAGKGGMFQCLRELGRRLPITRFAPKEAADEKLVLGAESAATTAPPSGGEEPAPETASELATTDETPDDAAADPDAEVEDAFSFGDDEGDAGMFDEDDPFGAL